MAEIDQSSLNDLKKAAQMLSGALGKLGNSNTRTAPIYDTSDLQDEIDDLEKSVKRSVESVDSQTKAFNLLADTGGKLVSSMSDQLRTSGDVAGQDAARAKFLTGYNAGLLSQTRYFKSMGETYKRLADGSLKQQVGVMYELSKRTQGLSSTMSNAQRNASLLGAAMIKSHKGLDTGTIQYSHYVEQLQKVVSGETGGLKLLSSKFKEKIGAIDVNGNVTAEHLGTDELAAVRQKMFEAETILGNTIGALQKAGAGDLASLTSHPGGVAGAMEHAANPDQIQNALISAAVQLEKAGIDSGIGMKDLFDKSGKLTVEAQKMLETGEFNQQIVKQMQILGVEAGKTAKELDRVGNTANGSLLGSLKNYSTMGVDKLLLSAAASLAGIKLMSSIKAVAAGLMKIANQANQFNIASVPASFMEAQVAAIKLGVSFEDATKFLQANKIVVALNGVEGADSINDQLTDTLLKSGYSKAQQIPLKTEFTQQALVTGVSVRSGDELNDMVTKTMDSFNNIRGIVDVTAEGFIRLGVDLAKQDSVQEKMLGLSKQQGQAYFDSLILQRQEMVYRGIGIEQAEKLIETQEAAKNESVDETLENTVKLAIQGQMAGISQERINDAMQTKALGSNATQEARDRLAAFEAETARSRSALVSAQGQNAYGVLAIRKLEEQTALGGAERANQAGQAVAISQAEKSETGVKDQAELARIQATSKGSETGAIVASIGDTISAIKNNSFFGVATTATTALGSLAASAFLASRSVGMLGGGKGILGRVMDMLPGRKGTPVSEMMRKMGLPAVEAAEGAAATGAGAAAGEAATASGAALAAGEGAAATAAGGLSAAALAVPAAITAAITGAGLAGYSAVQLIRGQDASNPISRLVDRVVYGSPSTGTSSGTPSQDSGQPRTTIGQPTEVQPVAFNPTGGVNTAATVESESQTEMDAVANDTSNEHLEKLSGNSARQLAAMEKTNALLEEQNALARNRPLPQVMANNTTSNSYLSGP